MSPEISSRPVLATLTLNPAIDRTVTIPGFTPGAVNRVAASVDRPGGKGINVAAALADAGRAVAALGFLGRDNADVFEAFFAARGIEDGCVRLPGATRVGIKIFDSVRRETTDINFPGLTPGASDLDALRARLAGLSGGWCVLAGSLPPGVPAGIYREWVGLLRGHGVRTGVDTSGAALGEAIKAPPDFIKPNVHELEALAGGTLSGEAAVIAAARQIAVGGVRLVVVSRGAEGACFVTAEEVVVARPPVMPVRSTVGAGDAMVAGVVAAQADGLSLTETARLGTAFAMRALLRAGDDPGAAPGVEALASRVWIGGGHR
jgi:1-phosphofructokinase